MRLLVRLVLAGFGRLTAVAAAACLLAWAAAVAGGATLTAPPPTAWIIGQDGRYLTQTAVPGNGPATGYGYWPVEAPPPNVVAATLALEDRRFWRHPGIDPAALLRAALQHLRGGRSGASTIAMQVARMQHPRPRTLWAKAVEAGVAVALVARYGHGAVLAQYLRLAPYGEGSHGIAHAAQWYFNRPPGDLSRAEAALLCAIPQAPSLLALHRDLPRAKRRARLALARMDLTGAERDAAGAELARLAVAPAPRRTPDLLLALRLAREATGGGVQRASIEPAIQSWVADAAARQLRAYRGAGAQQEAVMVVRRAGRTVAAAVGSAGWWSRPAGAIDFTAALRSPGSTLKPFVYALALQRRSLRSDETVLDAAERADGISNADHDFLGAMLPRQALANSRNVPAADLLRRVGLAEGLRFLQALGLAGTGESAGRLGLSMAIGALPTSLERLMRGYATLADGGLDEELHWFTGAAPAPRRLMEADAARLVGGFLSDPMARLPSFPRYGGSEYPFAAAVKTGTSQGYRDSWALAWSRDWVVGAWIGRADAGPMAGVSGARAAAPLVQRILLHLHGAGRTDLLAGDLPPPAGFEPRELCAATGAAAGPECSLRLTEWVAPASGLSVLPPAPQLSILSPEPGAHLWRNPEAPAALNRLELRAAAAPAVKQIVWFVDGQPLATAPPAQPVTWQLQPGRHTIQVRLPLAPAASRPVEVVVE